MTTTTTAAEYVEDLRANVGYNVRRLRLARGWTQCELGAKAGVYAATVRRVQRSEAHPNLDRLTIVGEDGEERTCLAFGVRRAAVPTQ